MDERRLSYNLKSKVTPCVLHKIHGATRSMPGDSVPIHDSRPIEPAICMQEDVDYTLKMHGNRFGDYIKCDLSLLTRPYTHMPLFSCNHHSAHAYPQAP